MSLLPSQPCINGTHLQVSSEAIFIVFMGVPAVRVMGRVVKKSGELVAGTRR